MLDAVPDSVFICTKNTQNNEAKPQALYANLKMNAFFGCDVVNTDVKRRGKKGKRKAKSQEERAGLPRVVPLKTKIFRSN